MCTESGKAMVARPKTIGEQITEAIEDHNRHIARLMALKAEAQAKGLLDVPQPELAKFVYPDNSF